MNTARLRHRRPADARELLHPDPGAPHPQRLTRACARGEPRPVAEPAQRPRPSRHSRSRPRDAGVEPAERGGPRVGDARRSCRNTRPTKALEAARSSSPGYRTSCDAPDVLSLCSRSPPGYGPARGSQLATSSRAQQSHLIALFTGRTHNESDVTSGQAQCLTTTLRALLVGLSQGVPLGLGARVLTPEYRRIMEIVAAAGGPVMPKTSRPRWAGTRRRRKWSWSVGNCANSPTEAGPPGPARAVFSRADWPGRRRTGRFRP